MRSMGGDILVRCVASSADCLTPWAVRSGSAGMPVGLGPREV
jgi:hypothetical protein